MTAKHLAGKMIAFEGIDQSGKQTVTTWLYGALLDEGLTVELDGFPAYPTPLGQMILAFLEGRLTLPAPARQLLYTANRWEKAAQLEDWIARGRTIILDRYMASGIAYGTAQGVDMEWLIGLEKQLPVPDITVLLDIPAEVSAARKTSGRDGYEADMGLLTRARNAYGRMALDPSWRTVDANADPETVRRRVCEVLGI